MLASVFPPKPASFRHRAPILLALAFGAGVFAPGTASAGGFEYAVPGARSLGRGGADVAGIDTGLALYFNPANLGRMTRARATVDVNLGIYDICMRRELVGDLSEYQPSGETTNVEVIDGRNFTREVCNSARPSIVPNVGVVIPLVEGLTLGAGILVPVSSQVQQFGPTTGYTQETGMPRNRTPTRYIITQQDLLQLFPTIGLGYQPIDELRFGVAFGWGLTHAKFVKVAYDPEIGAPVGTDAANFLDAFDGFVPRVTVSAATTPVPGLDIGATFTWIGDINAGGTVDIEFLGQRLPVEGVRLNAPQPWTFNVGMRFADLLDTPVGTVGDRLATERWDIELDLGVSGSSVVQDFAVDLPDDATLLDLVEVPDALNIRHKWKNQFIVRVGGDYNVVPGIAALRAGLSYESDGVTDGFEQIDFLPFRRVGLHLGGTIRIADRFDISIAYAHLFQETTDVRGDFCVPNGGPAPEDPRCLYRATTYNPPVPEDQRVVANAGIIKSSVNLLSLELDYAF